MSVYLGNKEVGVIRAISVSSDNITTYKYQDYSRAMLNGEPVATDEEYIAVEKLLQRLYKKIMRGASE